MKSAVQKYNDLVAGQEMIFSGVQYVEYGRHMKGHPFFLTDEWEDGTVWYDGLKYLNVPLLYDISTDALVIKHFDQNGVSVKIVIYQPKVSQFSYLNHTFLKLSGDSLSNLRSGYYELLYNGKTKLISRHSKNQADELTESGASLIFNAKDRYFLLHKGKYFPVTGKNSVLKVLNDKKSQLKQYARSSGFMFKENREQDLISMVGYYDKH